MVFVSLSCDICLKVGHFDIHHITYDLRLASTALLLFLVKMTIHVTTLTEADIPGAVKAVQ